MQNPVVNEIGNRATCCAALNVMSKYVNLIEVENGSIINEASLETWAH